MKKKNNIFFCYFHGQREMGMSSSNYHVRKSGQRRGNNCVSYVEVCGWCVVCEILLFQKGNVEGLLQTPGKLVGRTDCFFYFFFFLALLGSAGLKPTRAVGV